MNILFIGDIVGRPGRELVRRACAALVEHHGVDLVIANAENCRRRLRHHQGHRRHAARVRRRRDDVGQSHLGQEGSARLHRRPSRGCCGRPTIPPACPAAARTWRRRGDGRAVGVINVMGRVFMLPHRRSRSPSCCARSRRCAHRTRVIIVDFHAEATSEKVAMGWHLDGKVTRSSARTRTCRPPTSASCRTARRT